MDMKKAWTSWGWCACRGRAIAMLLIGICMLGSAHAAFPAKVVSGYWVPSSGYHIYGEPQPTIPLAAREFCRVWLSASTGSSISAGYPFRGLIDELRVTAGVARYVASYSVANTEFPAHAPQFGPNDVGHSKGDLASVTNPAGHVTQYTQYDRAGRMRQMIDPKGVVSEITYTPRGWVSSVSSTPPGGATRTTTYGYDNAGQLTSVSQPAHAEQ